MAISALRLCLPLPSAPEVECVEVTEIGLRRRVRRMSARRPFERPRRMFSRLMSFGVAAAVVKIRPELKAFHTSAPTWRAIATQYRWWTPSIGMERNTSLRPGVGARP